MKCLEAYFKTFCTRNPATIPMVVGKLAAQTPSLFKVFSSILEATTRGGQQAKQAISPGFKNWMCPELKERDKQDEKGKRTEFSL